ncbi:GNAT family N-acetyltransferase [Dictyobacter alpinus]|uniref:GNAT family N-acetyltransferase n=1 Tax=Dictyobacter alpinus TaxID=2014873 RepID=UPI001386FF33
MNTIDGSGVLLRDVRESDLPIFFEQQLDKDASWMAAFVSKDPANREAFNAHWSKILAAGNPIQTILFNGEVAGYVASYTDEELGHPEVTYWIGKPYWGKGIATRGLAMFLQQVQTRPMYGRAAKDNIGSVRVLEKCGFTRIGEDSGYANARARETEEYILRLE